jgi:FLVCR family MFS transporter 7
LYSHLSSVKALLQLWISFASVTDQVKDFYSLSSDLPVNMLSLVFFVVSLPVGFVGAWVLDTWGLRIGLLVGAWLNGIGAVVRYFSTFGHHYPVVMVGQVICAAAQPFVLFAPTKLASLWFGEKERATANMITSMANPVGVAIAAVASPAFGSDIDKMLWVYAIPAGVGTVMTTAVFSVWGAKPPSPPSVSADEKSSFWDGLKNCWKFKAYVFLLISWGFGVGMFNAIQTFIEQLLCTRGYSDVTNELLHLTSLVVRLHYFVSRTLRVCVEPFSLCLASLVL